MTSPNAPILQKILEKLTNLEKSFQAYVKNESDIQEKNATHNIRHILEQQYHLSNVSIVPIANFYTPESNDIFTDIDGCIMVTSSSPIHVKNIKGNPKILIVNQVYIIETKHGLTKSIIDKKLKQFCKIYELLGKIRTNKVPIRDPPVSNFDNMVLSCNLKSFPEEIFFVFGSDDINEDEYIFLSKISDGTLDEPWYNEYVLRTFKSHKIYKDIVGDITVGGLVKQELVKAPSIDDIKQLFAVVSLPRNAPKIKVSLEYQKQTIQPYKNTILSILTPYSIMESCYSSMKGRICIKRFDNLRLP